MAGEPEGSPGNQFWYLTLLTPKTAPLSLPGLPSTPSLFFRTYDPSSLWMALERPITDTFPHLPSLPDSGHSKRLTKLQTRAPWTSKMSLLPAETRQKWAGDVPCHFRQTEPNSGEKQTQSGSLGGNSPISHKKIQASLLANPKISRDLSSHQDRQLRPL